MWEMMLQLKTTSNNPTSNIWNDIFTFIVISTSTEGCCLWISLLDQQDYRKLQAYYRKFDQKFAMLISNKSPSSNCAVILQRHWQLVDMT